MSEDTLTFGEDHVWRFDRNKISKSDAWDHLRKRFPAHPEHHWRKGHTLSHWGWYAISECNWTDCFVCRPTHLLPTHHSFPACRAPGPVTSSMILHSDINHVNCPDCLKHHNNYQAHNGVPRYNLEQMWTALGGPLPAIQNIRAGRVGIVRAMEMAIREIFTHRDPAWRKLAINLRYQMRHLNTWGLTDFSRSTYTSWYCADCRKYLFDEDINGQKIGHMPDCVHSKN